MRARVAFNGMIKKNALAAYAVRGLRAGGPLYSWDENSQREERIF